MTDTRKDYIIKNCGCSGSRVWRVWEVEVYNDRRGVERKRDIRALTGKLEKSRAEAELAVYKASL